MARHIVMLLWILCACASGGDGEAGANGAGGAGGLGGHGGIGAGGSASGGASGGGGMEGVCGNGVAESDEACDQRDFGGKTCESYGLGPGTLICNAFCQVVVTSCSPS